jgi:uncharacterized membrane protein YcaP (DUF421 family)
VSWGLFRSRTFKKFVSGGAEVPIHDGKPNKRIMNRERITRDDIGLSLREMGIDAIEKVRLGYLEDDWEISALLYRDMRSKEQIACEETHRKKCQLT